LTIGGFIQSARGFFVDIFVRYGAGAQHVRTLTSKKWWNTVSWCLIVLGLIGWAVFIFWPY